jgi:uncharacterized membrane protein
VSELSVRLREALKDIRRLTATLLLSVVAVHPIILYQLSPKFRSEVTESEALLFTIIVVLLVLVLLNCECGSGVNEQVGQGSRL